jgi:hypothetical protein
MTAFTTEDPEERRQRYLRMAAEANKIASRARRFEMREACLKMVQSWLQLAGDAGSKNSR